MARRFLIILVATAAVTLGVAGVAAASGGNYPFDGGTGAQRLQVKKALDASSFNWGLVTQTITIHIAKSLPSSDASPGEIWLDSDLLDAGQYSWGVVQHEYAHEVDYYLLNDTKRALMAQQLGGTTWFYDQPGLAHSAYGCERFASTLAWAYWQSSANSMKPTSATDESAALKPAQFKALLTQILAG
jgi:hypothetical protein